MDEIAPIFGARDATDEDLAELVARRLDMELPAECVAGVASNARLLQRHVDILRKTVS